MNKRQIIASLNKIANQLDNSGLYKEASSLTNVMIKLADESDLNPIFDPRQKDSRLDTFRAMGHTRGGYLDVNQNQDKGLPRWVEEQRDKLLNPKKPEVLHPSQIQSNQKVDEIFPDFMENYEKLWDNYSDIDIPFYIDPRAINEISIEFLLDGANNPNEWLKNKIDKMEEKFKNWYQENFDFMIDHIRFIEYFMNSNNLNISQMEALLRKARS